MFDAVYVNFYRIPGSTETTSDIHRTRQLADNFWNNRWQNVRVENQKSTKQRVACIRVEAVCIDGRFDF